MTIISGDIARESKGVIEIFTTDNTVLISRISALFNAENTQKALRLIRQTGLQDDIDIVKGLENSG